MKAKPNNFPAEEEEKTFQYRSYGKGELASLYLPNITQQSAVERFNEWIDAAPGHRRCSGHVAPAGRQGREILRKGDTAR